MDRESCTVERNAAALLRPTRNASLAPAFVGLMLVTIVMLVFLPVRHQGYIAFDDADYVADNPIVQAGLTRHGIAWAFSTGHSSNWHPITWLSHMLDAQLFGPGPRGPHVVNLLLHVANTALVFLLLARWTGAWWRAAIVAALFALHPLRVESVAWISERKDVLSGTFFLLSLWAYGRYCATSSPCRAGSPDPAVANERSEDTATSAWHPFRATPRLGSGPDQSRTADPTVAGDKSDNNTIPTTNIAPGTAGSGDPALQSSTAQSRSLIPGLWSRVPYLCSLAFFALAVMAKPMAVTLPFVLLLLDLWPFERLGRGPAREQRSRGWRLLAEKLPFFALAAASSIMTVAVQHHGGTVRSLGSFSATARIENAIVAYGEYLRQTVWPVELAIFYPHPGHWPASTVALSLAAILLLATIAACFMRRFRFVATGALWFFGMLVPTIGLVQVGNQSHADRYTYLPSIGLFIVVVWAAAECFARWRAPRLIAALAAATAVGLCVLQTDRQLRYWRDSETLFRRALAVTERNFVAHNSLGCAFLERHRYAAAAAEFQQAIAIQPRFAEAHDNLGNAYMRLGRVDPALAEFEQAVALDPTLTNAQFNRGIALLASGRIDDALQAFERVIAMQPDHALAHLNAGNVQLRRGDLAAAVAHYEKARDLAPNNPDGWNNLGNAYAQQRRTAEAEACFAHALEIDPKHANAHYSLADLLAERGDLEAAIRHYRATLAVEPDNADARRDLARALSEMSRETPRRPPPE